MRISIAMCTYNGARHLQEQLDSIARQSLQPLELVVCDDGSTDSTLGLLGRFAEMVPFPVRISRNEHNLGSTKNFEKAIALCGGDLIALSDQDDEWYPDKLARMHRVFEEFPEALAAFSDADIMDESSLSTGRKLWRTLKFRPRHTVPYVDPGAVAALLKLNYIATGATMVFRSELRNKILPIPGSWVHDTWISWIAALRGGLAPVPAATIRYRVHSSQQIGVAPAALVDRVLLARQQNAAVFKLIAKRLEDLRLYLEQRREEQLSDHLPILQAKIRHLEGRASLDRSLLRRIRWIFQSRREYQRFARGWIAMVSDALIVSGQERRPKQADRFDGS